MNNRKLKASGKTVLVCPLDWGLGHATRCVPLIYLLVKTGCRVIIATEGRAAQFLKEEFPDLQHQKFPSYHFFYPRKSAMVWSILLSSPLILYGIIREYRLVKKLAQKHGVDVIIADNRFVCRSPGVLNVYISHVIKIQFSKPLRWLEPMLHSLHRMAIGGFDMLWIPDFEQAPGLAGSLSHDIRVSVPVSYLGPLSRFSISSPHPITENEQCKDCDLLVIISGPEPQRTIFEEIIIKQALGSPMKVVILRGLPGGSSEPVINHNLLIYNHLPTPLLHRMILQAPLIISRSGYTTIMDLAALHKRAVFVPTPGQPEQEYLADVMKERQIAYCMNQNEFNLQTALRESEKYTGFKPYSAAGCIDNAISQLFEPEENI